MPFQLYQKAFNPIDGNDEDGISVIRKKYCSAAEAAADGKEGTNYYVLEFSAADLQALSLMIQPDPLPGMSGHAIIPAINCATRDTPETQAMMDNVRKLAFEAHGPLPGKKPRFPTQT